MPPHETGVSSVYSSQRCLLISNCRKCRWVERLQSLAVQDGRHQEQKVSLPGEGFEIVQEENVTSDQDTYA